MSTWLKRLLGFRADKTPIKVPTVIEMTNKAVEDGCCVVIGLQATGQAALEKYIANKGQTIGLTDIPSTCLHMLVNCIDCVPVTFEDVEVDGGDGDAVGDGGGGGGVGGCGVGGGGGGASAALGEEEGGEAGVEAERRSGGKRARGGQGECLQNAASAGRGAGSGR